MVFTDPIQSAKKLEDFCKTDAAIVFHAVWEEEQGYRRIKKELEPLEIYCMKTNRKYNILELRSHKLLKDYSDKKKKLQVTRGVAFYKKGELLLEMKEFKLSDFEKACKQFDTMKPGKKEESSGCCSGCTIL